MLIVRSFGCAASAEFTVELNAISLFVVVSVVFCTSATGPPYVCVPFVVTTAGRVAVPVPLILTDARALLAPTLPSNVTVPLPLLMVIGDGARLVSRT